MYYIHVPDSNNEYFLLYKQVFNTRRDDTSIMWIGFSKQADQWI